MKSPVEQFTIKTLIPLEAFGYDISFTNASLFMILSVMVSSLFLYLGLSVKDAKSCFPAETISTIDYLSCQGEVGAKESGKLRIEGADYIVKDGDIFNFRFNV